MIAGLAAQRCVLTGYVGHLFRMESAQAVLVLLDFIDLGALHISLSGIFDNRVVVPSSFSYSWQL